MRWVLLWVVLLLGAGLTFALVGRMLWRKAKALTAEVTRASDRMAEVAGSLSELAARHADHADHAEHADRSAPPAPPTRGRPRGRA